MVPERFAELTKDLKKDDIATAKRLSRILDDDTLEHLILELRRADLLEKKKEK